MLLLCSTLSLLFVVVCCCCCCCCCCRCRRRCCRCGNLFFWWCWWWWWSIFFCCLISAWYWHGVGSCWEKKPWRRVPTSDGLHSTWPATQSAFHFPVLNYGIFLVFVLPSSRLDRNLKPVFLKVGQVCKYNAHQTSKIQFRTQMRPQTWGFRSCMLCWFETTLDFFW